MLRPRAVHAMRPQERMHLPDREWNPFLWFLPREYADLGIGGEHGGFHRDRVRMRWDVIRQNEHGGLTLTHEVARHGEDEVRVRLVHARGKLLDHRHRDFWPTFHERRAPSHHVVVIEERR